MECPKCKNEISAEGKFCEVCGVNLEDAWFEMERERRLREEQEETEKQVHETGKEREVYQQPDLRSGEQYQMPQANEQFYTSEYEKRRLCLLEEQTRYQKTIKNVSLIFLWVYILLPVVLWALCAIAGVSLFSILFS